MKYILVLIGILLLTNLNAQCYEDRHNTSKTSSWLSCSESENPNPSREAGHWIQYDLGETRLLQSSKIWNINAPEHLNDGAKRIMIDYSFDGVEWTNWGDWELERADGSGFYEGSEGPNFEGLSARYLLLTIAENHGGSCFGFGEIRVFYSELSSNEIVEHEQSKLSLYPNPAISYTELSFESSSRANGVIQVLDISGKVVFKKKVTIQTGIQNFTIPLDLMANGQYVVTLTIADKEYSKELTKISNH